MTDEIQDDELPEIETPIEPGPEEPWVTEHKAHLLALETAIGLAAIDLSKKSAIQKRAKANLDDLIDEYSSAEFRGPVKPEPPDPQSTLPLAFNPFTVDVNELDLTESLTIALHDADFDTIGKLQAKMQAEPSNWFEGLPGIGRGKATIVESAVGTWIENNTPIETDEDDEPSSSPNEARCRPS